MKRMATVVAAIAVSGGVGGGIAMAGGDETSPNIDRSGPGTPLLAGHGMSPASSQVGARTSSGAQLFRTDSGDTACLTDQKGSGHCAPLRALGTSLGFGGQACTDELPPGTVRITGLVPQGTDQVILRSAGGDWRAAVVNGTVAFEVPLSAIDGDRPLKAAVGTDEVVVRLPPASQLDCQG